MLAELIVPEGVRFEPVFKTPEDERRFCDSFNRAIMRQKYIAGELPVAREDYHLTSVEEAERQRNLEARSRRPNYLFGA